MGSMDGAARSARVRLRLRVAPCVAIAAVALTAPAHPARAANALVALSVAYGEPAGPLADVVASLQPIASRPSAAGAGMPKAEMGQRNSAFEPGVLPILVGTTVSFPNHDNLQHQVYSFSAAKAFELPLYSGRQAPYVRFDKPGVVVIGCNIHDWMIAQVVVLETPYFAKTGADGRALLQAPPGEYLLRSWHPRQSGAVAEQRVSLLPGTSPRRTVTLALSPAPSAPVANDRLRALQERFRQLAPKP